MIDCFINLYQKENVIFATSNNKHLLILSVRESIFNIMNIYRKDLICWLDTRFDIKRRANLELMLKVLLTSLCYSYYWLNRNKTMLLIYIPNLPTSTSSSAVLPVELASNLCIYLSPCTPAGKKKNYQWISERQEVLVDKSF